MLKEQRTAHGTTRTAYNTTPHARVNKLLANKQFERFLVTHFTLTTRSVGADCTTVTASDAVRRPRAAAPADHMRAARPVDERLWLAQPQLQSGGRRALPGPAGAAECQLRDPKYMLPQLSQIITG